MLRFATFLSPLLYESYAAIARYVSEQVNCPTSLSVGQSLNELATEKIDVAFLCGLLYVHFTRRPDCPIEVIAAPVVQGERYQGHPIYFSDVVVRRESSYKKFADLQGCTWAFNERASHSGYNIVLYNLQERRLDTSYFGMMLETGAHRASLQAILEGRADATAIDSHVFDVLCSREPHIAAQLRTLDMFGPTAIPPIVINKHIDEHTKQHMREALYTMHSHATWAKQLHHGLIERLAPIEDSAYDSIRSMWERVNEGLLQAYTR